MHAFDRQTDGQIDRQTSFSSLVCAGIPCSVEKRNLQLKYQLHLSASSTRPCQQSVNTRLQTMMSDKKHKLSDFIPVPDMTYSRVWSDVKPCSINQSIWLVSHTCMVSSSHCQTPNNILVKELKLAQFKNKLQNGLELWLKRESRKMAMCYFNEIANLVHKQSLNQEHQALEDEKCAPITRNSKPRCKVHLSWGWPGQPQSTIAISLL